MSSIEYKQHSTELDLALLTGSWHSHENESVAFDMLRDHGFNEVDGRSIRILYKS
jgi:hypothetical protein